MKISKRFTKFTLVGLFNTITGYVFFVILSSLTDQLFSFVITEVVCQNLKYLLYRKYVFGDTATHKATYFRFWKATLPYSTVVCINVLALKSYTPAYVTGIISLIVAALYYHIYKFVFRSQSET